MMSDPNPTSAVPAPATALRPRLSLASDQTNPHGPITSAATPRQAQSRSMAPQFWAMSG